MTLLVLLLEAYLSRKPFGCYGQHPHPYWIIVLTMAASRGTVAAILASLCATIPYVCGAVISLQPSTWTEALSFESLMEPLLFLGAGFLVGELRDSMREQHQRLSRRIHDLEQRNHKLRRERQVLNEANRALEGRLVDHSLQFDNLLDIATRLDDAQGGNVYEVSLDLLEEHCGGSASVWSVTPDQELALISRRGWPPHLIERKEEEVRSSPYVARAMREGLPVNGLSPIEIPPKFGPILVAPLTDVSGVITALLCLDDIPSSRLNESTAATFFGIADWISSALTRIARGDMPQSTKAVWTPPDESESVVPIEGTEQLAERLRVEIERQTRFDVVVSVLGLYVEPLNVADVVSRDDVNASIEREVARHLRTSDGIYELGPIGAYAVVLGGTSIEGARGTQARFGRRLTELPGSPFGKAQFLALQAHDLGDVAEKLYRWSRSVAPAQSSPPLAVDKARHVRSSEEFRQRVQVEIALGRRCGFNIHLVVLFGERTSPDCQGILSGHVEELMGTLLRPFDGAYSIDPHRCVLVLPSTGVEQASIIAHRLEGALVAQHGDPPYGRVHSIFFGLDPGSARISEVLKTVNELTVETGKVLG